MKETPITDVQIVFVLILFVAVIALLCQYAFLVRIVSISAVCIVHCVQISAPFRLNEKKEHIKKKKTKRTVQRQQQQSVLMTTSSLVSNLRRMVNTW